MVQPDGGLELEWSSHPVVDVTWVVEATRPSPAALHCHSVGFWHAGRVVLG